MKHRKFHKPDTPADVSRNANSPEFVLSCTGKDKKGRLRGYIAINFPLKAELEPTHFINLAFIEDDDKLNIALGCSNSFESEAYELTDCETAIMNNDLFNEIATRFQLDFDSNRTYHFYSIKYECDRYSNVYAIVDMETYSTSKYRILPYLNDVRDEWSEYYDEPTV